MNGAKEVKQIKNIAQACHNAKVKHVVWSTLVDTRPAVKDKLPLLEGDYIVPHFDAKGGEGN
jgi:hypothetical protein